MYNNNNYNNNYNNHRGGGYHQHRNNHHNNYQNNNNFHNNNYQNNNGNFNNNNNFNNGGGGGGGGNNNYQGHSTYQHQDPKEVFCGNLSFFCDENDLVKLFCDYARVEMARIIYNRERTKSLLFGFVKFETVGEALEMARTFNGQMFMGRRLK